MIYGRRAGVCPVCHRLIKLRRGGTIGHHSGRIEGDGFWPPKVCRGWLKTPLPALPGI